MTQKKNKLLVFLRGSLLYIYLLFIILLGSYHSIAAQTSEVDSLYSLLAAATSDSERITLMDALSNELINTDLEQSLIYAQKALEVSRQIVDKEQEVKALNTVGLVLYETENRPSSIVYFEESECMANEMGLRKLQVNNLMSIARYHRYVSHDSTKTVEYLLKSVAVSKSGNYHYGTGRSYAKLASFYTKYNQIDLSESYLELATEYYLKQEDGRKTVAHYYNEVGDKIWDINPKKSMDLYLKGKEFEDTPQLKASLAKAYSFIGDHKTALNYLKEAIPYFRAREKRKKMLGVAIAQLAETYIQLGNYEAAKEACNEGIALLSALGRSDQKGIPALYRVKGIIAEREGKDTVALAHYIKSQKEAIRIKFRFERIKGLSTIGIFYSSRDREKGKTFCKKALKDAKKARYAILEVDACDCLYNIYKEEDSFADALQYHEQKILLTDSLSTLKVGHALDINTTIVEKDKLLAEQAHQKEIKNKELKFQNIFIKSLLIISIFGLILIGFLTLGYQRISKQNKEINEKTDELLTVNLNLERSNEELERFAHIASHDLKSPLRNIISYTQLLRLHLNKEEKPIIKDSLNFIENSGKRMNCLIEDVLEFSKISNEFVREPEVINLSELVKEISQSLPYRPDGKPVIFDLSELPSVKWNSSKLFLLFKNIIENGIKYNESDKPTIKLYSTHTADRYSIYIQDNGIGIEQEYFEEIFTMFKRLHNYSKYEGTGLGLATCKKVVDEFEGTMSLTSKLGKGTTFIIEFPAHLIYHQEALLLTV